MRVEKNYIKCIQVFVVLFFTLVVNISVKAQTIQISGKVTDADSGEPLPTTSVILDPKSLGIGAVTDFNGRYSMQAPAGATSILFSYVGYEPVTIPFPKGKNKAEVNVKLKSKSIQLSGTVITAEKARYRNKDNPFHCNK